MLTISAMILAGLVGGIAPHLPSLPQVLPQGQTPVQAQAQAQGQTQTQGQLRSNIGQSAVQAQFADQGSASAGTQPYQATLMNTNGDTAQVRFANGATQSFTVDSNTKAELSAAKGKQIAFRVVKGSLRLAQDVKWALLERVRDGVATLRDIAGNVSSYAVSAATAAQLQGTVGKPIAFTLNGNTMLFASNQTASPSSNH